MALCGTSSESMACWKSASVKVGQVGVIGWGKEWHCIECGAACDVGKGSTSNGMSVASVECVGRTWREEQRRELIGEKLAADDCLRGGRNSDDASAKQRSAHGQHAPIGFDGPNGNGPERPCKPLSRLPFGA